MPLVVKDRVRETSTTTGTGTFTLAGAVTGYQSFSAVGNGNTTYYTIYLQGGNEWEVGIGTYTASGTTLSRDTILASSNGGSAVNFSAGVKDVFVTYPADRSVWYDTATNVTLNALTVTGALAANGGTTIGDASGDAFTINSSAVSVPNGLNFDSNTLVIDAANDRVGIGTNSPFRKLDIALTPAAQVTGATIRSVGGTTSIGDETSIDFQVFSTSYYNGRISGYVESIIGNGKGGLKFYTSSAGNSINATPSVTIDSSGNVGIGTDAPAAPLSFASATGQKIRFYNALTGYGIGVESSEFRFVTDNSAVFTWGVGTYASPTERMRLDTSGTLILRQSSNAANTSVSLNTTIQNALTLEADGDLLVGTTTNTNSSKLVVNGTISETVSSTQYLVASQFDIGTAANEIPLNQYLGNLAYQDAGSIAGQVGLSAGTAALPSLVSATDTDTGMWFPAANTLAWSTNGTRAMTVDSSQNVLIGRETSDGYRLALLGVTQKTTGLQLTYQGVQAASISVAPTSALVFGIDGADGSTERVRINGAGGFETRPAANGHAVFNEDSVDADFRVESDSSTHALFVDAGNSWVGINNSSPVAPLSITSAADGSPTLTTSYTRLYTFTGTVLENNNYQIFKVTVNNIRVNALLRISLQSENTAGIGRPVGSIMEVSVSRVDGNALFYVKSVTEGNISLSEPVASGNDIIFGAFNSNNGTGIGIGYACSVELVSGSPASFVFTDIAPGTAHTGADWVDQTRIYRSSTPELLMLGGATIFNEDGNDQDFRVESDTSTHAFFVDASADSGAGYIGIRNSVPTAALEITRNSNQLKLSTASEPTNYYAVLQSNYNYGAAFNLLIKGGGNQVNVIEWADSSGIVFNQDGLSYDFRVESDSRTHMLYVNAAGDQVLIGAASGNSTGTPLNVVRSGAAGTITKLLSLYDNTFFPSGYPTLELVGWQGGGNTNRAYMSYEPGSRLVFYTAPNVVGDPTPEERAAFGNSATVFNEQSYDVDFRVESDTNTHALFVDAGNSKVGINWSAPSMALTIGAVSATGAITNISQFSGIQINGNQANVSKTGIGYQDGGGGGAAVMFGRGGSYGTDISFFTNSTSNTSPGGMTERGYMGDNGYFYWYSGAVFNENGDDADFRVESDANTHMLFLDAGSNTVSVGTSLNPRAPADFRAYLGVHTSHRVISAISEIYNSGNGRTFTITGGTNGASAYLSFSAMNHNGTREETYYFYNAGGNWTATAATSQTAGTPPTVTVSGSGTATVTIQVIGAGGNPAYYNGGFMNYEFYEGYVSIA